MALPPRFLDELRDKVSLSELIGKKVKLTRRGREYTGLCPFHHEKTPSFTINDDKGFYHCFGCGAHGDAIKYLMDGEKMPFMEAIEYLAGMAGVKIPELSPVQTAKDKQQSNLAAIMEEACRFFQAQLFGPTGAKAKNYLINRGISADIAKQFRLGYAPNGSALTAYLKQKGIDLKICSSLGLIAQRNNNGQWHDYFYDRIMFPILDRRKRVIGFGGRMLEKGEPKYLNSPETSLFHKGEQLYALPNAIDTIRKKNEAILVEGYMDVIALHAAGFTNAVAPLGTALTESQIKILWQSCDEPLICFDGDGAGQKASIRALNRALPILSPGKSLRFVTLPPPFDPDDMIRKKSPEAFAQVVSEARSLSAVLWENLLSIQPTDTPERMAKFEDLIQKMLDSIQNQSVRSYYAKDFKDRLWRLTHQPQKTRRRHNRILAPIHSPTPGLSDARMMLAHLICYPTSASEFLEEIAVFHMPDKILNDIFQNIIGYLMENPEFNKTTLESVLSTEEQDILSSEIEMLRRANKQSPEVIDDLKRMILQSRIQSIQAEIVQKTANYMENPSSELWETIKELKKEIEKLSDSE